jgi:hypothetical protein
MELKEMCDNITEQNRHTEWSWTQGEPRKARYLDIVQVNDRLGIYENNKLILECGALNIQKLLEGLGLDVGWLDGDEEWFKATDEFPIRFSDVETM